MSVYLPEDTIPLLSQVFVFSRQKKVSLYMVGGYLRDILLRRRKADPDVDFCIKKGALAFGRKLAGHLRAGYVVLDRENGSCRVVKKSAGRIVTIDITDFRGKDLRDDLLHRDFTINTLALPLEAALSGAPIEKNLIDHFGAVRDIGKKIIRTANPQAFDEDPLRILRAFSIAAVQGFTMDRLMVPLLKKKRKALASVSRERIRDELFKIFGSTQAHEAFLKMDSLGILAVVIPELDCMRKVAQGPYHHLDVFRHSFETLRQFEMLLVEKKHNSDIQQYVQEALSAQRPRAALLKFACLVHDIGKPRAKRKEDGKLKFYGHEMIGSRIAEAVAKDLKLSNHEVDAVKKLVFYHLRPGYLGDRPKPSARAVFRYFRDTQADAPGILLLSLADQRSTRGPLTTKEARMQHEKVCAGLIKEYFRSKKEKVIVRLLNGDDLIKAFELAPSPLIGALLTELQELQAIGKVKTKAQALEAAKRYLKKQGRFSS